jgi:hypothetical protein
MSRTFGSLLGQYDITVPDVDLTDIEIPVLTGVQRQGDVGIFPTAPVEDCGSLVPPTGVQVVRGEATGNTHFLHGEGPVFWAPAVRSREEDVQLGTLIVPEGSTAFLIHTDEHAASGIGPGTYLLHGKREQADLIRRVAD